MSHLLGINGQPKQVPAVVAGWDADAQDVVLQFDPKQFRQWAFVEAVLGMALEKARAMRRQVEALANVQALREQREAEALAQELGRRREAN